MSQKPSRRAVPPAARVFGDLQASEALSPGGVSALRKTGALFLMLLFVSATPLFFAAFAAGVIGDTPAAVAKSNSGPGGGDEDNSGPGSGDDDDDDTVTKLGTDDTSANGHSTRGTTDDNDTKTKPGTDDTSANAQSTQGTTNDNDTGTKTGTQTHTGTGAGS